MIREKSWLERAAVSVQTRTLMDGVSGGVHDSASVALLRRSLSAARNALGEPRVWASSEDG